MRILIIVTALLLPVVAFQAPPTARVSCHARRRPTWHARLYDDLARLDREIRHLIRPPHYVTPQEFFFFPAAPWLAGEFTDVVVFADDVDETPPPVRRRQTLAHANN